MLLLGLSGSLRQGSFNHRLLLSAAATLPAGVHLDIFEGLATVPPYNDDTTPPPTVQTLRQAIATADGVLVATPEYNASIPGQLKNALDWASRPFPDNAFRGRPVAVIGASTGLFGAVWAQAELRKVLSTIGAEVVDAELAVGLAHEAFDDAGLLVDHELHDRLAAITALLIRSATETGSTANAERGAQQRCA